MLVDLEKKIVRTAEAKDTNKTAKSALSSGVNNVSDSCMSSTGTGLPDPASITAVLKGVAKRRSEANAAAAAAASGGGGGGGIEGGVLVLNSSKSSSNGGGSGDNDKNDEENVDENDDEDGNKDPLNFLLDLSSTTISGTTTADTDSVFAMMPGLFKALHREHPDGV